jgi:hypothetical protein
MCSCEYIAGVNLTQSDTSLEEWGEVDPDAIYNLCLIVKIVL